MANLAVMVTLLIAMLEAFQFGWRYDLINRTFYGLSPALIQVAIAIPGFYNDQEVPFYDQSQLQNEIVAYLDKHLYPEFPSYELGFHYYDPDDGMLCSDGYCQGVVVRIIAPLTSWLDYDEQLSFEITATS